MINYKVLNSVGTTAERAREVLTRVKPADYETLAQEEKDKIDKDLVSRKALEELIISRTNEGISSSLRTYHLFSAADLAWDSTHITKRNIPLVLYAQKRITTPACAAALEKLGCADEYVKKDAKGDPIEIKMPKFTEVYVNLIRSVITRRTAAQCNRFNNLWPFFKYESRSTNPVEKLRADMVSQRVDIMADQFGYRSLQTQAVRDMLLYGHSISFPRCSWEREVEWYDANDSKSAGFASADKPDVKARITKEGVFWATPHPSRVFWDKAHPVWTLNSDSGCTYAGYWDVLKYSDVLQNPAFFNRQNISFNSTSNIYQTHPGYFQQYFTRLSMPIIPEGEQTAHNDSKNQIGVYSSEMGDSACFFTHHFCKLHPQMYGIGTYPYQVWFHFITAGDGQIVFVEIMPSCPAAVFSYNESDNRAANLSLAHELMPYQDQLSNLFSQLLECAKRDLFSVFILNKDVFPDNDEGKKAREAFRSSMEAEDFYAAMSVIEASFSHLRGVGIEASNPANILQIVRTPPNTQLNTIFQSISQLLNMAERLIALSPQEQGQMSPRETSATEVQIVATTTENVYSFISDSIDEGRAAWKRYNYDALISLAQDDLYLPVINRYPINVIQAAGFTPKGTDAEGSSGLNVSGSKAFMLAGTKRSLIGDFFFSTRDGAERSSNVQGAQTLIQLMQVLQQPAVLQSITKEKFQEMISEIFRLSGAGVDLNMIVAPGQEDEPVMQQQPPQAAMPPGPAMPPEQQAPVPAVQ